MNTGIKVKVENEVTSDGRIGYKVLKVQALTKAQLPKMYLEGQREVVFLTSHCLTMYSRDTNECKGLCVGEFLSIQKMAQINAFIKAAGSHLTEVNEILAEKRVTWNHGKKVTFIDGKPAHFPLPCTAAKIAEAVLSTNTNWETQQDPAKPPPHPKADHE